MIPQEDPIGLGLPLLAIGLIGLVFTFTDLRTPHNDTNQAVERKAFLRRTVSKLVAMLILLFVAGMMLISPQPNILWWMIAPMFLLLMSASLNTWALLIAVQEVTTKE